MKSNESKIIPLPGSSSVDTLIVSDVHLGSKVSRAKDLIRLLESYRNDKHNYRFNRLVLLGDIFDDLNFNRMDKHAWKLAGMFRKMSGKKCNSDIVWILGNHDLRLAELMKHLVGLPVYREYEWNIDGKKYLAVHGDQFDKWIVDYYWMSVIPTWFYDFVQKIDGPKHRFSRFLKETSKKWLRINKDVADKFIEYVKKKPYHIDNIFCGHTHIYETINYPDLNTTYYNSGCWTGSHDPTYITITTDGEVRIRQYTEKKYPKAIQVYPRAAQA